MSPNTLMMLLAAAGSAQGAASSLQGAAQGKRQAQVEREQLQQQDKISKRNTALAESEMDPFRHQLQQGNAIASLDKLERAKFTPVQIQPAGPYASYVPKVSGGASYEKSPELISSAAALKRNVMGGNTAPTMTDPMNYGKTAALDLVNLAATGADPARTRGAGAAAAPPAVDNYYDGYQRRMAGSIGASETRGTDFSVAQAAEILNRVFTSELGRAPQPGEIEQLLTAQGLKRGDRWVGEAGLTATINALRSQAPQASYA